MTSAANNVGMAAQRMKAAKNNAAIMARSGENNVAKMAGVKQRSSIGSGGGESRKYQRKAKSLCNDEK
jgi:hypothetical protein